MDNQSLGVALLALYGFVEEAKPSAIFKDRYFRRLFGHRLGGEALRKLSVERVGWGTDDHLALIEPGVPSSAVSVLAYVLLRYFDQWTYAERMQLILSFEQAARKSPAFEQYRATDGTWNVPEEKETELKNDDECCYWTERVAKSMYKVLVFEAMRMLTRTYGELSDERCERILGLPQFHELSDGKPARSLDDFREQPLSRGPITALARILHLACALMWQRHSAEIRTIQSPQQALLAERWVRRLSDQVELVCGNVGNARWIAAMGLSLPGETTEVSGMGELLPTLEKAR